MHMRQQCFKHNSRQLAVADAQAKPQTSEFAPKAAPAQSSLGAPACEQECWRLHSDKDKGRGDSSDTTVTQSALVDDTKTRYKQSREFAFPFIDY
jgi:hypothetical protein